MSLLSPILACAEVSYDREVRAILSENCFHCHGPDAGSRQADLRLDTQQAAHEWAIVPGDVAGSAVASRLRETDPDLIMPPPDSGRSLTEAQIKTLEAWIEQGAGYERHWAFVPPRDVQPPKHDGTASGAIDAFINAKLAEEELQPNGPADRATWLRRASFDLTGLPPTIDQLNAFLADDAPGAKARQVDRLLASPRFGERLASDWLDAARYADSYGYQVDRDRRVWPWRDWVVRSFNANMPYDTFLTHQLAGDLLPPAETPEQTRQQILATTFNRLHSQKVEGGSVPEEFRVEYVADRTQTVATAMLGLTMECCRCHDHKYDPLPQTDYFGLAAYFDNIDEAGLYSYFTPAVPTPALDLPSESQRQALQSLHAEVKRLEQSRPAIEDAAIMEWLGTNPKPTRPTPVAHLDFEIAPKKTTAIEGITGQAIRLDGDTEVPTDAGRFTRQQPFTVASWIRAPESFERAVVFHASRAWTDAASRGYELLIVEGRLQWSLIHFWPGNAASIRTVDPLPVGSWQHVTVMSDGSSSADGLTILLNGRPVPSEVVRDGLTRRITYEDKKLGAMPITIGARFRDRGFTGGAVDEFRVYDRVLSGIEAQSLITPDVLPSLLATPWEQMTEPQRESVADHYRLAISEDAATHRDELAAAREAANELVDAVPQIMVMRELPSPRPTHRLDRGSYDQPAEVVDPAPPAVLPNWGQRPANRLELARWLMHPDHPLTARVAVNRYWQLLMGRGLVETSEDFGRQGSPPSHPDLLDWLARRFVESGWDVKQLLRAIVLSDAYGRVSTPTPAQLAGDPHNIWLARGPSGPLPAEMLRDQVLFVSGLLQPQLGGEPAKPYEVEQSFRKTARDTGQPLYRRSLYTYWRRTAPAPAMLTLGAAKRDVCAVRRESITNPLQALVLQNGPQYAEAARMLAAESVAAFADEEPRLRHLFRTLTSRQPSDEQLAVLTRLLDRQRDAFTTEQATAYLQVGEARVDASLDPIETAATASVAATLLNYAGVTMKR